jgi:hypothetical protein
MRRPHRAPQRYGREHLHLRPMPQDVEHQLAVVAERKLEDVPPLGVEGAAAEALSGDPITLGFNGTSPSVRGLETGVQMNPPIG